MKSYHTVIFDLDGTLLNTIEDLANALNHSLTTFGFPARTLEEVRSFVGNGLRNLLMLSIPDGFDNPKYEEVFAYFKSYYTTHCKEITAPYPGIIELITTLHEKQIPMAIVSNKNDVAVKQLSADFFEGMIPVAIGEREGVSKKPAPDTVFLALSELGEDIENAVYIGDSEVDIKTAANAGMDCISVSWGFRDRELLEKEGASVIIDTPSKILEFLI